MKLNRKTFIYSILLSLIIVGLFLSYMLFMLPSLYVAHTNRNNLNEIKDIHDYYITKKEYDDKVKFKSVNSISMHLPKNKNIIKVSNYFANGEIKIVDEKLKQKIEKFKYEFKNNKDSMDEYLDSDKNFEIGEIFPKEIFTNTKKEFEKYVELDFNITDFTKNYSNIMNYSDEMKTYGNTYVFIANSDNEKYAYTNYILLTYNEGNIFISFFSLLTPLISDIKEPIYSSLPMIMLIILILSIFVSKYFSNKIVNPIIKISEHAENSKELNLNDIRPIEIKTGDEVELLANRLNELYEKLKDNYKKLEEESKRKEVFLRASSHQLRTPISAALLLVNGMIDEIGKYKNTNVYLPELKKQVLEINNMVSEVLSLNHIAENIYKENINLYDLVNNTVEKHKIIIEEKSININLNKRDLYLKTDYEILYKIIDNLINNAVKYSDNGGDINIILKENRIEILNTKSKIPENIIGNIFEPFVSNDNKKGHGLGLYLVSYYLEILGYKVEVKNVTDGVLATVKFY